MKTLAIIFGIAFTFVPAARAQGPGVASGSGQSAPVLEGYLPGSGGARLFFRVVGSGSDTIIVIHGGPATGLKEGASLEPLATHGYTLIFYDQRGAGMSELVSSPAALGLAQHVEDLDAVRRRFQLNRVSLITLSWGSAIALHYAIAHPGNVERMALLNPFPPTGRDYVRRFAHLDSLRDAGTRKRLRAIDSLWPVAPDSDLAALCRESALTASKAYGGSGSRGRQPSGDVCDYPPDVLRHRRLAKVSAMRGMGAEYDFTAALRRMGRPLLVVEGAASQLPLDASRVWAREAADGRMLLIPHSSHRTWLDQPALLFTALDSFFRGNWPVGASVVQPEKRQ
ncbi:MAG: alpha/beta hydrolase [Gemmatimonadota bacterium]